MNLSTMTSELAHLREDHERAERLRQDAADAERAAYLRWQEAYGAYELASDEASDEASAARTAWVRALTP